MVNMYTYIVGEYIIYDCVKEYLFNECYSLLMANDTNMDEIHAKFKLLIEHDTL